MNYINEEYIEDYILSILPENEEFLKELELYASENHVPIVDKEVAQFLKVLLKIIRPKKILEVGTAIGYSALIMASSTDEDCKIKTIERRSDMVKLAEKNINNTDYKYKIEILQGEANEILPDLNEEFDFIFLDAAKGHYLEFFNDCTNLLKNKGVVVSDNVLFRGMVASDELIIRRKKTIVKRLREYLGHITDLDGYETSVIPIGDGVALTYKEE